MSGWLTALGASLGLTLLFEGAFALLWGLRGRDLLLCALANLLTNPPLVFCVLCWRHFGPAPSWLPVPFLEALAVWAEGRVYRRDGESIRRPYLFSLCANAFSYTMGLVFSALI